MSCLVDAKILTKTWNNASLAQSDILHLFNPNKKQTLVGTAPTVAKRLKKTSGMDVGQILAMCIFVNCDFRKTNGVRDPNKHPEKT